jgi:hypothetical protein
MSLNNDSSVIWAIALPVSRFHVPLPAAIWDTSSRKAMYVMVLTEIFIVYSRRTR